MTRHTHSLPAVNSTTAITVVEASNSLADLAARIKNEHEASGLALKRGLGHAIACGRLLMEAKARVPHGHWGPWLREHCGIPERSVQRYMELAVYSSDSKSANLADLAVAGAANAVAGETLAHETAICADFDLIVERMLAGAFTAQDFDNDSFDWIKTKLLRQLKVPAIVSWCFQMARMTVDGRPALRLCPWNELGEAAEALAPVGGKKTTGLSPPIRFDANSFESMGAMRLAINQVEVLAAWMLGGVLHEMKGREYISDERYAKEWDETHQHVITRLEVKLAALENECAPERVS
jgi:hypothetical protein